MNTDKTQTVSNIKNIFERKLEEMETEKLRKTEEFPLYDFIHSLFDKKTYAKMPNRVKKKHFFMTLRFVSIKYPKEADKFNINGINEAAVMDLWHMFITKTFGDNQLQVLKHKYKEWIYASSKKKVDAKDKFSKFPAAVIKYYLKKRKMDRRDFDIKKQLFTQELYDDVSKIEKFIEDNGVKI